MAGRFCEFCKIVRNEVPASRIYEDERVMAFLDIRPLNEGHTLVLPKKHYETIYNVPDEEIGHLFKIVRRVATAVKKAVNAEGITISQHNERAAGQDIFHLQCTLYQDMKDKNCPDMKKYLKQAGRNWTR